MCKRCALSPSRLSLPLAGKDSPNRLIRKLGQLVGIADTAVHKLDQDPRARVFFNNGWDGFDPSSDEDVSFYLKLRIPLDYVHHIEFMRQLTEDAYHFERGIAAQPELLLDPYHDGATFSVCFGSSVKGQQTEHEYDLYFRNYQPVIPTGIGLYDCDGNDEAMWVWNTAVPTEWISSDRPFIQQDRIVNIANMVEGWIEIHNREIERVGSAG